jgi:hypothetical protein
LSVATAVTVLCASWVLADPILHEYFDFDDDNAGQSDRAVAAAGAQPAERGEQDSDASRTARPKDAQRGASKREDGYQLDANTRRPEQVGYEDPFTPAIPPFKRQFAYDSVDTRFELVVRDPSLTELRIGGVPLSSRFDQFFGDIELTLEPGTGERIPSVGPSAIVLAARLEPAAPFQLRRDGAENWFLVSSGSGPARLTVHLAIDRAVFGSPYGDPTWRELAPFAPEIPDQVEKEGLEVAARLGVDRSLLPSQAVSKLVEYFRSFAPSEQLPKATNPEALYREIALSRKGVCRHRAYAFTVTALALGLPTRFVRNEAHAWVEVFDASLWHRIDLGGAAAEMQLATAVEVAHVPPADPFAWPPGSESAGDMTDQALRGSGSGQGSGASRSGGESDNASSADVARPPSSASPDPSGGAVSDATPTEEPSTEADTDPSAVSLQVELEPHDDQVTQGGRVHLAGRVEGPSSPCALVRVDVVLVDEDRTIPIGSLVTDDHGAYDGSITLPHTVPIGHYDLRVLPHAAGDCRASAP